MDLLKDEGLQKHILEVYYSLGVSSGVDRMVSLDDLMANIDDEKMNLDPSSSEYSGRIYAANEALIGRRLVELAMKNPPTFRITEKGMDGMEGKNQTPTPSQHFNFHGDARGNFGSTNSSYNEISTEADRAIEKNGGEDKEELRRMMSEIKAALESQDSIPRSKFEKWSELANKHFSWLLVPMGTLLTKYMFGGS